MKITAGKYRGRNIEARDERTLRPTTAKIRETIFNILMHGRFLNNENFITDDNPSLIKDRRVLDIFCGTGALGLEALSRGAAHLTLIDQNSQTLALARKNIKNIGEEANTALLRSDSTMLPLASVPSHLIFIDPPYGRNLVAPALNSLANNNWLKRGSVIVIEQGRKDDLCTPPEFQLLDNRIHDKTKVIVMQFVG